MENSSWQTVFEEARGPLCASARGIRSGRGEEEGGIR